MTTDRSRRTFADIVVDYEAWYRTLRPTATWSRVTVREERYPGGPAVVTEPAAVESFGPRFEEILAVGCRDWVNVTGRSNSGVLELTVEYFDDTEPRYRPNQIAVNFSASGTEGA